MSLCKYKDIFGKTGEGVHSYRVFNIAIVDVIATIVLAIIISAIFNTSFVKTLFFLFLLGIILHRLFCVKTTVDMILFE